ncbi:hypothetical protein GCM10009540_64430 [Streptomyces turgidiscabies]
MIQARCVKWSPSPYAYALPTPQATTTTAVQAAYRHLVRPCSARWTTVPRNITARITRPSHTGTVPLKTTSTSARAPATTPPNTRSRGDPALVQQTAITRATAVRATSGPVPTASERAEGGSVTPAATLTAASTARVRATGADRSCRRTVKRATTRR